MNASSSSAASASVRPQIIAVVDDIPEIQALASQWLTSVGHQVLCAEDGQQLLKLLKTHPVDIVVSDVNMPEADGFEVINAVKATYPKIKIITISGGSSVMPMNDCLRVAKALGAAAVLPKPFTRSQLLAVLNGVIGE